MRRVKLFIATSLDGYIARPDGGVDWLFDDQDYGMTPFYRSVDTVLLGRKTYDFMLAHGVTSYEGKQNYVFSRTPQEAEAPNVEFVAEDPAGFVDDLCRTRGRDIWLVGGAELFAHLHARELVDDFILSVHPVILGDGIPLFNPPLSTTALALHDVQAYASGLVQLAYSAR